MLFRQLTFFVFFIISLNIRAELVQILHTNDLHTHFDHSIYSPEYGGYAKIKSMVDHYRAEANEKDIPTYLVDAGDFLEGHIYYFVDQGVAAFNILDAMGYDAVVIGNHDWLMGASELNNTLGMANPKFAFLGANFIAKPYHLNINKYLKPSHTIKLPSGQQLTFLGLTTNDIFYKWRVEEGDIKNYVKVANRHAKKIKKENKEARIIAITHIGHNADKELAAKTSDIDLIIGGHSHVELHKELLQKNQDGHLVPIVQTGSKGKYLGKLILDVKPGKPIKIVSYQLVPVKGFEDNIEVAKIISSSKEKLYNVYGQGWLMDPIAYTEIPLKNDNQKLSVWGNILADTLRESVGADMSLHFPAFSGSDLPIGPLSRMDIFQSYPRYFDFKDSYGWHVWHVHMYGFIIKALLKLLVNSEYGFSTSGVYFELETVREPTVQRAGKYKLKNVRIGGEKLKLFKRYSIALPEGIVRGGFGITKMVKYILRQVFRSPTPIWTAVNDKIKSIGIINENYQPSEFSVRRDVIPKRLDFDYQNEIENLKKSDLPKEIIEEALEEIANASSEDYPDESESSLIKIERVMVPSVEFRLKE